MNRSFTEEQTDGNLAHEKIILLVIREKQCETTLGYH